MRSPNRQTELIAAYYLTFLGLLVLSTVVFIAEAYHDDDTQAAQPTFRNYGEALWWGVVTVMAVGYGDVVPRWWLSRVLTAVCGLICVSLFTLISSVIGVGLTLMVQDRERQKAQARQRPAAAALIGAFYRTRLLRRAFHRMPYFRAVLAQRLLQQLHGDSEQSLHKRSLGHLLKAAHGLHRPHLHRPHFHMPHHQHPGKSATLGASLAPPEPGDLPRQSSEQTLVRRGGADSPATRSLGGGSLSKGLQDSRLELEAEVSRGVELALVFAWELRWRLAKRKFHRARRPYELLDITEEVSESEQMQLGKLREVEVKLEALLGKPALSLLSPDQTQPLGVVERLQLVEGKLAQLNGTLDALHGLASQLPQPPAATGSTHSLSM